MIHLILDSTSGVGADFLALHPNVHCISLTIEMGENYVPESDEEIGTYEPAEYRRFSEAVLRYSCRRPDHCALHLLHHQRHVQRGAFGCPTVGTQEYHGHQYENDGDRHDPSAGGWSGYDREGAFL